MRCGADHHFDWLPKKTGLVHGHHGDQWLDDSMTVSGDHLPGDDGLPGADGWLL